MVTYAVRVLQSEIVVLSCSDGLFSRLGRISLSIRFDSTLSPEQAIRLPSVRIVRFRTAPLASFSSGVNPARPSDCAAGFARSLSQQCDSVPSPKGVYARHARGLEPRVDIAKDFDELYEEILRGIGLQLSLASDVASRRGRLSLTFFSC